MNYVSFCNLVRTGNRTLPWTVCLLYCVHPLSRECVLIPGQPSRCVGNVFSDPLHSSGLFQLSCWHTHWYGNVLSCPLPSNGLFRLSWVIPQYIFSCKSTWSGRSASEVVCDCVVFGGYTNHISAIQKCSFSYVTRPLLSTRPCTSFE
jgi:hypothetical protein